MNLTHAHNDFLSKELLAGTKSGIQSMDQLRLIPQRQRNELCCKIEKETN
jgi:hypothetical protein